MHLSDGEIRAYLDGERLFYDEGRLQSHLEACPLCRQQVQASQTRGSQVDQRLQDLRMNAQSPSHPNPAARQRMRAFLFEKEKTPMFKRVFSRPYRPAWAALGVIAVLALALAFPPVQAIANSFLGLFRVQKVTVVDVNPGDLPNQLGSSSQLEAFLSDVVNVEQLGETQPAADAAEASQLAGMQVRLPALAEGERMLMVHPGAHMSFAVDLPRIQAILDEIGRGDIRLPAELDGSTVTIDVAPSVAALYGECEADLEKASQEARRQGMDPDSQEMPRLPHCTTLLQMPSPEVNAPAGLDVAQVGEAYLQLLGMSPEEAARFSSTVDWTSTFVVPIPRYGTTSQTVSVDGVEGTFIQQGSADQYLLMWVKDGLLYALTGPGDLEAALRLAGSIE